ncbi:MAG: hypothetical protein AABW84_02065 [Nanoarchaeota archaeon]
MTEKSLSKSAVKFGKIFLGIIVILAGLGLIWYWWGNFLSVLKGVAGVVIALIGLVIAAIGWSD